MTTPAYLSPGDALAALMAENGIGPSTVAHRAGMTRGKIVGILRGERRLTRRDADGLQIALGLPASVWMRLQNNTDEGRDQ